MTACTEHPPVGQWRIVEADRELLYDGSVKTTFAYHNGDEAILKAKPITPSTG